MWGGGGGGWGSSVKPLRLQTLCMGPTWGAANQKNALYIFGISASIGV